MAFLGALGYAGPTPPRTPAPAAISVGPLPRLAPLAPAAEWPEPDEFEWDLGLDCDASRCTWMWSDGDASWMASTVGWVEPDEQGTQIGWLDEDSSLTIERTSGGATDRLVATGGEDGMPSWSGTVGGREVAGDEARSAAERLMPAVLDHTGLFASQRVAHLVEAGGPAGALQALRDLPPGSGRQNLLQCLLLEHELDAPEFGAALELAAQDEGSDAMLAELLACVGPDALGDPELEEPLFRACESIDSDAYLAETLGCLMQSDHAESTAIARALGVAAAGLESDAYAAEMLGWVPGPRLRDPAVREAFVAVLDGIESDAYAAEVLGPVLGERVAKGELLSALLAAAARGVDSDAYMAEVLQSLPGRALADTAARDALQAALASVESDAYMAEVLEGWLCEASPATAAALLTAATGSLDSDAYMAEVLCCAPESVLGDAAARPAFDAALATIQSSSYRLEVLENFGLVEDA
ncbi:MAG: hypothetical protein FJ296_03010 [Planctomycetes bacterium]|nr:hypothetical protein [Planctomycetota bacterium]